MKIIVATRDLDYGVGSIVKNELKNFDENKNISKIIVICPKKLEGYSNKLKFDVIPNIGQYFITKQLNFAFRCNKKIKDLILEEKIDKIYLHFPIFAEDYGNVKLISKFHGLNLSLSEHRPKGIKYLIASFFHNLYSYFDYRTIKYSDRVLFVSKRTLKEAKKFYPEYGHKFAYSSNFIDKSKFFKLSKKEISKARKELNLDDGKKNLLFVGRLEPLKGILDLLDVLNDIGNSKIRLVVIGDGPLKKEVIKKSFVDYRGKISNDELYKYYNASHLFVLPSYYENSPITLLEAKACGCKILARNVGDISYMLKSDSIFNNKNELKNKILNNLK